MKTVTKEPARKRLNSRVPIKRQRARNPPRTARASTSNVVPATAQQLNSVSSNRNVIRATSRKIRRNLVDQNIPAELRRPVVCDGESLAYDELTQRFDAARISAAVSWFERAGHRTVAIVPNGFYHKADNQYALDNLANSEKLLVSEHATGSAANNPPFETEILAKALQEEAAVISEREFRQPYYSDANFQPIVSQRVIGFTFFKNDIFIPVDPYGRYGPLLKDILKK